MRVFEYEDISLHISSDCLDEQRVAMGRSVLSKRLERYARSIVRDFKRLPDAKLVGTHQSNTGLEGYILLDAHGTLNERKWMFEDGKRKLIVQNWINKLDGKALALLLYCCNPHYHGITAKKSAVIHATMDVDRSHLARGRGFDVYIPGKGYSWEFRETG